ncbi:hypothetical protein BOX15_Mlig030820g1 [Macrostomum lignano]|uniref:Uncharacterized protein n=1 Tax=Macrostomum lignano TaxID=282301 RepID=A0A267G1X4_9PLAT|nr:hypothetical protein BOX15_Mlig030820g1 [Macrostomum lignano]
MIPFADEIDTSCLQEECNTTWLNTGNLPAIIFFRTLPVSDRALVVSSIVIAFLSNCLYIAQIVLLVRKKCSYNYIKLASTLLALYPVYQNLSCIAMIIPRAVSFIAVLVGAYTMIVFNDFSNMMSFVFGGFRRLLDKMDGQELQRPRLCSCLPKTYWTKRRVVVTRALVRQGKLVYYIYVVLAAILLLNGNYEKRPLEVNRPLFWLSVIAGISRFAATISLVAFVRSVIKVLTGYSLGRKFVALQIINIFHLVTSIATTFLKSRNLPISNSGLVSADNRIDLYGNFAVMMVTTLCQLWAFVLFHRSPRPNDQPGQFGVPPATPAAAAGQERQPQVQPRRTSSSYTVDTVQSSVASGVVDDSVRQVVEEDELYEVPAQPRLRVSEAV